MAVTVLVWEVIGHFWEHFPLTLCSPRCLCQGLLRRCVPSDRRLIMIGICRNPPEGLAVVYVIALQLSGLSRHATQYPPIGPCLCLLLGFEPGV
jgi:hypothetical protein